MKLAWAERKAMPTVALTESSEPTPGGSGHPRQATPHGPGLQTTDHGLEEHASERNRSQCHYVLQAFSRITPRSCMKERFTEGKNRAAVQKLPEPLSPAYTRVLCASGSLCIYFDHRTQHTLVFTLFT